MIGKINIRVSAANPQMPLGPFYVFTGSAASFTICDIPLPLGVRKVQGVTVQAKNVDGVTTGFAAVRVGSAWGVTVPAGFFSASGSVEKGIAIEATGLDDSGENVSTWKLGAGDVEVMEDDGSVAPGETRIDLEWFDEVPENPRNGYVAPVEGIVCVYRNGEWRPLGSQGDVRRADFQDIQELGPADSAGTIKERFNVMLRKLKGTSAVIVALLGFCVWAELGPDMIHDDIPGTATVREIVQAGGDSRMLPKYLRALRFADSYPDEAAWYYSRYGQAGGACSSVRDGNTLARNYDWDFNAAPSWVIGMEAGPDRFASVGVSSVGTNITAGAKMDGSPFFKALPGMTLDGVNENGVAANINVVSSFGHANGWHGSELHCLGAVRWVLDHATNAQHGAEFLAANVYVPQSMIDAGYSYHYMIADEHETWIAEDGQARMVGTAANRSVMTNFRNFDPQADPYGTGRERYTLLENGGNITSAWFTLAYVAPGRESEFRAPGVDSAAACARAVASWATKPKEQHRGETFGDGAHWWQSVHTSIYDLANRVLRVSVQETDDWYTFQVPNAGCVKVESDPTVPSWAKEPTKPTYTAAEVHALPETYTPPVLSVNGKTGAVTVERVYNPNSQQFLSGDLNVYEYRKTSQEDYYTFNVPLSSEVVTLTTTAAFDAPSKVYSNESRGAYLYVWSNGTAEFQPITGAGFSRCNGNKEEWRSGFYEIKWHHAATYENVKVATLATEENVSGRYVPTSRKINGQKLTGDITIEGMTENAAVLTNGVLKTKGGTAITAGNVGAVAQGTLATVATSGSYNDLLNKPTIPEAVTDQHIKEVAEENRTDHPYLEVRDGGIYVVIPE